MSSMTIETSAPAVSRTTAQRVADGVVADYLRALSRASAEAADDRPLRQARTRACQSGRAARPSTGAHRRHPARRRALLSA